MAEAAQNPLISTSRASDSSPAVALHPLVLLTISDCITRHTLRQQTGPVVGAILGAQDGQNITMEVAFQAKLKANSEGDVALDDEWFSKRLEDCMFMIIFHGSIPLMIQCLKTTSQRRSQATTTGHCRLVHARLRCRPRTPHSAYTFAYIRALH